MDCSEKYKKIVDGLTIGVVVVDSQHKIYYHNERFVQLFAPQENEKEKLIGRDFYCVIGSPLFIDGCYAPLYYAQRQPSAQRTILSYPSKNELDRRFEMLVSAVNSSAEYESGTRDVYFKIELKEISEVTSFEQRLEMLRNASNDLAFFTNEKISLPEDDLKEQLKEIIKDHMRIVLNYDVFEIRVVRTLDRELVPFLDFGMGTAAIHRKLFVNSNKFGIMGFVASSKEPYICNDTKNDPLYVEGAINAKSSITVPILLNKEVIGVCNVESCKPNAFSTKDKVFLELYAKTLASVLQHYEFAHEKGAFVRQMCKRYFRLELEPAFKAYLENVSEKTATIMSHASQGGSSHCAHEKTCAELLNSAYELREKFETTIQRLSAFQTSAFQTSTLEENVIEAFPCFEIVSDKDKDDWEKIQTLLPKKKFLLVAQNDETLSHYKNWLNKLGCRADYCNSTKMALQSLNYGHYDAVLCERYPDGRYFPEISQDEAHHDSIKNNQFSLNRYDVHEGENYFPPAENDVEDAIERQRIFNEIIIERKFDAYFFLKEIYSLNLNPTFFLAIDSTSYDPTHIQNNVNKLLLSMEKDCNVNERLFSLELIRRDIAKAQRLFFKRCYSALQKPSQNG